MFDIFQLRRRKKDLELEVESLSRKVGFFEEDKKRALTHQAEDHTRLMAYHKEEHRRELERVKKDMEIKLTEIKSLTSLEAQQKTAQAELRAQANMNDLSAKHSTEISKLRSDLAKEYYDKMQEALKDLTLNGSEQSKFVQEIALKMFDKGMEKPMPSHFITESRLGPS